jgi:hypothetical protein
VSLHFVFLMEEILESPLRSTRSTGENKKWKSTPAGVERQTLLPLSSSRKKRPISEDSSATKRSRLEVDDVVLKPQDIEARIRNFFSYDDVIGKVSALSHHIDNQQSSLLTWNPPLRKLAMHVGAPICMLHSSLRTTTIK